MTLVMGFGVLALVAAQQAYHQKNGYAKHVSTGLLLANEIREITFNLPRHDPITGQWVYGPEADEANVTQYDDIDDFGGGVNGPLTISPPISALRQTIPNMTGWSQVVTVEHVAADNVSGAALAPFASDVLRITARIDYQSPQASQPVEIVRQSWIASGGP